MPKKGIKVGDNRKKPSKPATAGIAKTRETPPSPGAGRRGKDLGVKGTRK